MAKSQTQIHAHLPHPPTLGYRLAYTICLLPRDAHVTRTTPQHSHLEYDEAKIYLFLSNSHFELYCAFSPNDVSGFPNASVLIAI